VVSGSAPNLIENVHYRPYDEANILINQPWDIVVVSRWEDIIPHVQANPAVRRLIFWSHDFLPSSRVEAVFDRVEAYVTVSMFHAGVTFGVEYEQAFPRCTPAIMENGVDTSLFTGGEERDPNRLIWASNPNRGLFVATRYFREMRKRFPKLEFHIFGRSSVYGWNMASDPMHELAYLPPIDEPGIYLHDPLPKPALARELMKSFAMFYPSTYAETFSIACLESQAAGTPVITTPFGALVDTVQGGIQTWGPQSNGFQDCIETLRDPEQYELASLRGKDFAAKHDWAIIAGGWDQFFRDELAKE